jgi:NAD(P)-dependent dehydrogenase (short-subunit alcohol dehydrogenase family)
LVLADLDSTALEDLATSIDGSVLGIAVCDTRSQSDVQAVFDVVDDGPGLADIVVNSVGRPGRGMLDEVSREMWDDVLAVNLTSVFTTCRAALPYLRRSDHGTIVNLASVAGVRERPGSVAYSAAKGGVVMFSKTLAADLAGDDIRVFAVCPTAVDTERIRAFVEAGPDPAAALSAYEAQEPMGRMLSVEEIARVVADLCSAQRWPYTPEPLVI